MESRGFTLYEVLVVMVVIIVMAGVVAPSFSAFFPALKTQKTADAIVATAAKARADAALTMRRFRLHAVTAGTEDLRPHFFLAQESDPLLSPGVFSKLPGAWGQPEELPEDVTFETLDGAQDDATTGEKYYEWRPDGTATEGTIVVTNPKGDRVTIKIAGTTGKVSIEEPQTP